MTEEVKTEVLFASYKEKAEMAKKLMEDLQVEAPGRCDKILKTALATMGLSHQGMKRSRSQIYVFVRRCVAYEMYQELFSIQDIATFLGITRASVMYNLNMMKDTINNPHIFRAEYSLYVQFKNNLI